MIPPAKEALWQLPQRKKSPAQTPGSNGRMALGLLGKHWGLNLGELLDLPARVVRDVHRRVAAGAGKVRHSVAGERLAAGDALIFARAAVMMCVPHFMSGCDLSRSRVSKLEKIMSPSASASTQAPSI